MKRIHAKSQSAVPPIGMKKDPAQKYRVSSIYIRKSVSVIMYCRRRHCASGLYETLATV